MNSIRLIQLITATGLLLIRGCQWPRPYDTFRKQSFFGGNLTLEVDTRKSKALSMNGVHWLTSLRVLSGLNDQSRDLTQLKSDFSFYLRLSKALIFAGRFGGGHNFNKFEFYQAQYLGGTENLRGFRKYRFAGKSMAYNNLEMRVVLGQFKTYLFPGAIGILVFHDVGRVWVDGDNTDTWKNGYGARTLDSSIEAFCMLRFLYCFKRR